MAKTIARLRSTAGSLAQAVQSGQLPLALVEELSRDVGELLVLADQLEAEADA